MTADKRDCEALLLQLRHDILAELNAISRGIAALRKSKCQEPDLVETLEVIENAKRESADLVENVVRSALAQLS